MLLADTFRAPTPVVEVTTQEVAQAPEAPDLAPLMDEVAGLRMLLVFSVGLVILLLAALLVRGWGSRG